MDDKRFEEWVASLTIKGGEAFLPGEIIPADKRRAMYRRRAGQSLRSYKAEWMRRQRARQKETDD